MQPLAVGTIAGLFVAAALFTLVLDWVKLTLFSQLAMA